VQIDLIVAKNYAHALLVAVQKHNMPLEEALQETAALQQVIEQHPQFMVYLEGPQFRETDKEAFVERVFKDKINKTFYFFLLLVLRRNRPEYLPEILEQFKAQIEQFQGIVSGTVQTAIELNDERKKAVQQRLEAALKKKFHLTYQVNSGLIGGVRLKFGDTLYDSSIETDLKNLRKTLNEARILAPVV
jgi:F-type H+-transporting ATPase subunit delta